MPRKPRVDKMKNRQAVIKCQVSASPLVLSILPPDPKHVFLSAFKSRASLTFDTRQNLLNPFNFNPSTLLDTIPTPSISACDTHFIPFSYLFAFLQYFWKILFFKTINIFYIFKLFLYIYVKNKFLKIKNIYFFNLFSNEKQIKKHLYCIVIVFIVIILKKYF